MTRRNQVIQAVASAAALPTLPAVILQGARVALGPEPRLEGFIPIVEADPVLTIRVMKAVHDLAGEQPLLIRRPADAVRALGFETVRETVLSTPVLEVFLDQHGGYGIDPVELWMHGLGTALFARELAAAVEGLDPGQAYLAGLLHDIGKLVLACCCRETYPGVVQQARQGAVPLHNAESERLGYQHAEIGAWLAEPWRLPTLYAQVILNHHHPLENVLSEKSPSLLTGVVALANNLCYGENLGSGGDPARATLPPNMFKNLGIPRETIKHAIREAPRHFQEAMARIDWEPVSREAFRARLDAAERAPLGTGRAPELADPLLSSPSGFSGFQVLQGVNGLGLSLLKCDTLEAAAGAVASGLLKAFSFARVVCAACKDDQWEYRAEAARDAGAGETRLVERSMTEDAAPDPGNDDPWLHIELNGKGRVLGSIKVKPGGESGASLDELGLLLAACAKLAAQAFERIGYQQRVEHLASDLTLSGLWPKQERETPAEDSARQEDILKSLPLGLLLLEPDGTVAFANPEAERLLGSGAPLAGGSLQALAGIRGLDQSLVTVLRGTAMPYREDVISHPGAPARVIRWRLVPLRDGRRPVERLLLVAEERGLAEGHLEPVLPAGIVPSREGTRTGTA